MKLIENLIILLISLTTIFSCGSNTLADMCGNRISKEITSPDKKLKAVIFTRDCGATTGFSSQLSIIGYFDKLKNEKGNVLIISDKEDQLEDGSAAINAEWNGNNELIIYFNLAAETSKKEARVDDVKISYKQLAE